jgi:hypothetical protein
MKYLITESRIEKIIVKYLEEKDFIDKSVFSDNQLKIYLSKPTNYATNSNLSDEIKSLFGDVGVITFFRPSKTENHYIMIGHF